VLKSEKKQKDPLLNFAHSITTEMESYFQEIIAQFKSNLRETQISPKNTNFSPKRNSSISTASCGIDSLHMVDKLNTYPCMNQCRNNEPNRSQIDDATS
jgi:hypothetical protein